MPVVPNIVQGMPIAETVGDSDTAWVTDTPGFSCQECRPAIVHYFEKADPPSKAERCRNVG